MHHRQGHQGDVLNGGTKNDAFGHLILEGLDQVHQSLQITQMIFSLIFHNSGSDVCALRANV